MPETTGTDGHCQPIATLTLNPAVDIAYEVDQLVADQKTHARVTRYDPGGNGINVARALKELMVCAHSCCIVAGNVGALLQRLLQHHLDDPHCIDVEGETRINATILQSEPAVQYEVTGIGPRVSSLALAAIRERFLGLCKDGFGVLTGSVPPGVDEHIYADLLRQIRAQGGFGVVDAHGPLLHLAIAERPFLIKPNRYELGLLCGRELPRLEDVAQEGRRLQRQGVEYVCVSLGGDGALLVGPTGSFYARAPTITVRSTVGSGDSMVAGLVAAFARGQRPEEALRLAVACGSGTATQPGTALFSYNALNELLRQTEVTLLDI
ncbi:MAG: 1-phosphofructokinase family hexose kinase [Acidithiobacillus sp.]